MKKEERDDEAQTHRVGSARAGLLLNAFASAEQLSESGRENNRPVRARRRVGFRRTHHAAAPFGAARPADRDRAQVVDVPGVLIVHPSVPVNSVKELVAYVKANPGKLNYASPGSGSQNRLEMEILRTAERGMDMVHVPYKGGAGPAVTGLVAGETQMMFSTVSSAMGHIKGGRLKALAITSPKRIKELPDLATMKESGYADGSSGSWQGVLVPAGTPREIVERLYAVLVQTMKTPDVIERLAKGGAEAVTSSSPKAFADFVASETQRWGKVAKESGAIAD
ncbi:MAG: hypothetical protein E6H70_17735 [Betaproteobacteria bacterium]|nr:MAG: hypothetical protein E6H70_17735 [Betaproteobacteria bacterium]